MRPGLIQLEIGVQSTNVDTITEINRTMDFVELKTVVEKINAMGNIHQHLDLIAGLPFEGIESFQKSFQEVYSLKPNQLQLGFLKVLKGSYMHQMAESYGIVYRSNPVYEVLYTNWLSHDELLRIRKVEEMVEVYYNSGQFSNVIKVMVEGFETPFKFYEALGEFYETKGYLGVSLSRMARYDILLDFAREYDSEKIPLYKELLLYDLYLRENVKSRPAWAEGMEEYKERIREFYLKEEENRTYLSDYEAYNHKQMSKMTHIEVFSKAIFDENAIKGKVMVLFDYNKRNPLTYEALNQIVGEVE
jgi:hypothetical protein